MILKLESTTTELRKGSNLAWYNHLTHITCVQKLRGLRQKLDALHVQTGPSLSKYEGFRRKLICFEGISFFKTYFNSILFFTSNLQHSKPHTEISTLSDYICYFHAFNDLFSAK